MLHFAFRLECVWVKVLRDFSYFGEGYRCLLNSKKKTQRMPSNDWFCCYCYCCDCIYCVFYHSFFLFCCLRLYFIFIAS